MKTEHRDFGDGNQVKLWEFTHSDGETEYGVIVEREYDTYCELECESDKAYALGEFHDQIKIMKEYVK